MSAPPQFPGSPKRRWYQPGWLTSCRALGVVLVIAGCGDVQFHLSPYTPENVELILSAQEHVSVVRWRVTAAPPVEDTRFELWGPNGYTPIAFDKSVFPGGITPCADGSGSCAQYVTRERLDPPSGTRLVRAVHSQYGVLPGAEVKSRWLSKTMSLTSFFRARNDEVFVNVEDAIGTDGPYNYPRSFERAMWPTDGLCVSDSPPEGVSFSTLDNTGVFPPELPLTENGIYCVATRPIPSDGGDRAFDQTRIATLPEVLTAEAEFKPPIEASPILYQIVLDLQIPIADRCADAISGIEGIVRQYLRSSSMPVETRQLQTINLAVSSSSNCDQDSRRQLPAAAMAQEIKKAITSFPEVHQQFHLLYFNNLAAILPETLNESFRALLEALSPPAGYELTTYPWMFNSGLASISDIGWNLTPWTSIEDPGLIQALILYSSRLPYRTQLHPYDLPVPLLSDEEAAAHDKQLIKICFASPYALPVTKPDLTPIYTPSWEISADDPPYYLVDLPIQIASPQSDFIENVSLVQYQICTRYCVDHPYRTTAGEDASSWKTNVACVKDP